MLSFNKYIIITLVLIFVFLTFVNNAYAEELNLKYDIVIYSGQPSGVFAAVSAARNGLSTLLILKRDNPGGLMTYGGLNYLDLNYGTDGRIVNKGMFDEWYERLGKKQSFSFEKITESFKVMLNESNVDIIKNANLKDIKVENKQIKQITIRTKDYKYNINADYFIDADQDGNFAYQAGAKFFNLVLYIN